MTNPNEEEEQQQEQKKRLLAQLDLVNRLFETQEKGEKITFDLDNPHVREKMERLEETLRKKLGEGEKGEEIS